MMAFVRQVWTLIKKNLLVLLARRWFWTIFRAVFIPTILIFLACYSKNWIAGSAHLGVGPPHQFRTLPEAIQASSGRHKFLIADNGFQTGDIDTLIRSLSAVFQDNGVKPIRVKTSEDMDANCPANIQGYTSCWGGVDFKASPDHPLNGKKTWSYALRHDQALSSGNDVNSNHNNPQVFIYPLQNYIDSAIAATNSSASNMPDNIQNIIFSTTTQAVHDENVTAIFQTYLYNYVSVIFFVAMCGITYHMTGYIAYERESGMTQLLDTMIPGGGWYRTQTVRFIAAHLSFDIVYLPSWIVIGALVAHFAFPSSGSGTQVVFHILTGLSLASTSLMLSSLFKRSRLSGVTAVILSLVLSIAALYGFGQNMGTYGALMITGFLFPPMTYIYFIEVSGWFQTQQLPLDLSKTPEVDLDWTININGYTFFGMVIFQIIVFPMIGSLLERWLFGVSAKGRTIFSGESKPYTVRMQDLHIQYNSGKKAVRAVQGLSLDWLPGSITVLLGVNGSGKTTVLNAISGQKNITSGAIDVDGTGGFGICPQKNVMWAELTVVEHVRIFSQLKRTSGQALRKSEVDTLIEACDLEIKKNAKSKTLSGGQKRKLQLAMMFAGGSRVCCIDEVSSGLDPLARRKIWDILLAERHQRSILLTTHFLEEADVLADHIAIMSKGTLKVQGSTVELKTLYGGGYRVVTDRNVGPSTEIGYPAQHEGRNTFFTVPDSKAVTNVLVNLERNGINNYRVEEPTTEHAFLGLAEELHNTESDGLSGQKKDLTFKQPLELAIGPGIGLGKQMWILLLKRFTILRSHYIPYLATLFVPICTAGMVTRFFRSTKYDHGIQCTAGSAAGYYTLSSYMTPYFMHGPEGSSSPLQVLLSGILGWKPRDLYHVRNVTDYGQFVQRLDPAAGHQASLGGLFQGDGNATIAWALDNGDSPSLLFNVVNQILTQVPITFSFEPFNNGAIPENTDKTIQLAIYMGLALAVYPAFFALYPTLERIRQVRALHYSNGIRSAPLWSAYFLFDFIFVIVISIIIAAIWSTAWAGWYSLGSLAVVFILYGMTATMFAYCMSMFAKSQLGAWAAVAGYQCFTMIIYFVSFIVTQVFARPDLLQHYLNIEFYTICLISPVACMLRALFLSVNSFYALCRGPNKVTNPAAIDVYGGPILYLILQFFALTAFLIYWDAGGRFRFLFPRSKHVSEIEGDSGAMGGSSAQEDPSRLTRSDEGVQVCHLTKRFGSNTALDDVSFGIRRSETLALLGPNGAGKSTLISLMRGSLRPSDNHGQIFIEGGQIENLRDASQTRLGVCGQFDAMDAMTVRQQLTFYARARGVSNADVGKNVSEVMRAFDIEQYENRHGAKLSGGNQRKVSLACALVGGPTVLLLDEPSSGMDPYAKRTLWNELSHISHGRVLLLSTHSMEEADALCDRALILARKVLALGTTEELRERHGALHVHIVHKDAPHANQGEMERIRQWIESTIPNARVEDRTYHGQLRFSLPSNTAIPISDAQSRALQTSAQNPVGALFELMEGYRESLGIAFYSIGKTTLDDVFINVVREHNVAEENYRQEEKGRLGRMLNFRQKAQ